MYHIVEAVGVYHELVKKFTNRITILTVLLAVLRGEYKKVQGD